MNVSVRRVFSVPIPAPAPAQWRRYNEGPESCKEGQRKHERAYRSPRYPKPSASCLQKAFKTFQNTKRAGFLRQFGRHVESLPSCAYVCDVCCLYTAAIGTAAAQQLGHSRLTMLILLSPISRIRCFSSSSTVRRSSARLRPDRAGPALASLGASSRLVDSDKRACALRKQSQWERI